MSIQQNFPAIKPTLLLDFANTKQLDPHITFTRASTATFYGTQTAKAEENLLLQSQDFTTTWSVISGVSVTANSTTAPDGTTTADTLVGNGTSSIKRVAQNATPGGVCVFSCFVKKDTNDFVQFYFSGDSTSFANFNVSTGAVGTTGGTVTASIVDAGNGWYRCIAVNTSTAVTTVAINLIDSSSAARAQTTTLSTSVFLWGAQLEQRSAVSAYTATTTQPITNYIPVLQTAASGVPRFEHNPITFESLGLEIEEQRTNLLVRSEEFDNASWTKSNATITANTIVSPDGTLDGDKLVEDATTNEHNLRQVSVVVTSSTAYTATVYAKAAERTTFRLLCSTTGPSTGFAGGLFNLSAGTASVAGTATVSIQSVGNGWYRCQVTVTSGASQTAMEFRVQLQSGSYAGDGYSGLYIWGAQLETGAFATSYISTVASQVTRAADAASMTGTNFSSWYNQAEGTFYAAVSVIDAETPTSQVFLEARSDATNLLGMYVQVGDGFLANNCIVGGVVQAQLGLVDLPNTPASFANAFAYKVNDFAGVYNGAAAVTDASGTVPANTALYIGNRGDLARPLNGTIRKIAYYPIRVSNTNLQALTS